MQGLGSGHVELVLKGYGVYPEAWGHEKVLIMAKRSHAITGPEIRACEQGHPVLQWRPGQDTV